jgi:hypothetical protein
LGFAQNGVHEHGLKERFAGFYESKEIVANLPVEVIEDVAELVTYHEPAFGIGKATHLRSVEEELNRSVLDQNLEGVVADPKK